MQSLNWTPAGDGMLVSEAGPCRLTVATIGGLSRFLVHRRAPQATGHALPLVASGTRSNLSAAMAAAEATASRIAMRETPPAGAVR